MKLHFISAQILSGGEAARPRGRERPLTGPADDGCRQLGAWAPARDASSAWSLDRGVRGADIGDMSLPPGFLDELRTRVSLSQVVGRKVTWDMRKSNMAKGDFWAPCPFHQEKSPSFTVSETPFSA